AFDDTSLHRLHTWQGGDLRDDSIRRALQAREHLRESIALVVSARGFFQCLHGRQAHHEHADAGGHDQTDRDDLAANAPQVAPQLAIEHASYHDSSLALRRVAL